MAFNGLATRVRTYKLPDKEKTGNLKRRHSPEIGIYPPNLRGFPKPSPIGPHRENTRSLEKGALPMKVLPLLIKDLLESQQAPSQAGTPPAPSENPISSPERTVQQLPHFQVAIPSENPGASPAEEHILAAIPDVTDPPVAPAGQASGSSIRFGGRLFSPNLSARILLGGGVVLFLIAALPILFRSVQPPEQGNKPASIEGQAASATGSVSTQKTNSAPLEGDISSVSGPSGTGPSAQQTKAEAQPTPTGRQAGTTPPACATQQSAQNKPAQQPGKSTTPPDQGAGTSQLASQSAAGGEKPSERGTPTSAPSSGTPAGQTSSARQTPTSQAPSGSSTRLADTRSQLPSPNAHDSSGGPGNDSFQGGVAPGETLLAGQKTTPSGYAVETRSPTVYYPTSANYSIPPNSHMVYYPSTDGRWYPVLFPPGRPRSSEATYSAAGPSGQAPILGRQEPVPYSGLQPAGGYSPRNQYQEVSRREPLNSGGFGYPNQQDAGSQVLSDRRYSYPSTRGNLYPSGPAGYPPSGSLPQYGPSSGGFPGTSPANSYPPDGGVPSGRFQPFGRSTDNGGFGVQEPGVARFNGTIEKPPIRSAYDGTGSSLY